MVIWSESLDRIIPLCQDFEDRLIKLLWRGRPVVPPTTTNSSAAGSYCHGAGGGIQRSSTGGSVSDSAELVDHSGSASSEGAVGGTTKEKPARNGLVKGLYGEQGRADDPEAAFGDVPTEKGGSDSFAPSTRQYKRTWYGKKVLLKKAEVDEKGDVEELMGEGKRPVRLYAPLYNGLAAGIALCMFDISFFWLVRN